MMNYYYVTVGDNTGDNWSAWERFCEIEIDF